LELRLFRFSGEQKGRTVDDLGDKSRLTASLFRSGEARIEGLVASRLLSSVVEAGDFGNSDSWPKDDFFFLFVYSSILSE
jgi:hypothetical protein